MFIVLEGVDGSGKTTICDMLKAQYPGTQDVKFLSTPTALTRTVLKDKNIDDEEKLNTLIDEMKQLSNLIKKYVKENKMVVCDRWIYSTYIYQMLFSFNKVGKSTFVSFIEKILSNEIIMPDYVYIPWPGRDEIIRRLKLRGDELIDLDDIDILIDYYKRVIPKEWFKKEEWVFIKVNDMIKTRLGMWGPV